MVIDFVGWFGGWSYDESGYNALESRDWDLKVSVLAPRRIGFFQPIRFRCGVDWVDTSDKDIVAVTRVQGLFILALNNYFCLSSFFKKILIFLNYTLIILLFQ